MQEPKPSVLLTNGMLLAACVCLMFAVSVISYNTIAVDVKAKLLDAQLESECISEYISQGIERSTIIAKNGQCIVRPQDLKK